MSLLQENQTSCSSELSIVYEKLKDKKDSENTTRMHVFQSGEFLRPSHFSNEYSYSDYVKERVTIGMPVECCKDFLDLEIGDLGVVRKIDNNRDLSVKVKWQNDDGVINSWIRYNQIQLLPAVRGGRLERAPRSSVDHSASTMETTEQNVLYSTDNENPKGKQRFALSDCTNTHPTSSHPWNIKIHSVYSLAIVPHVAKEPENIVYQESNENIVLTVDNVTAVDKTLEKVLPPSTGFFEKNLENDAIIDQQEDEDNEQFTLSVGDEQLWDDSDDNGTTATLDEEKNLSPTELIDCGQNQLSLTVGDEQLWDEEMPVSTSDIESDQRAERPLQRQSNPENKCKRLPKESLSILTNWFNDRRLYPYAKANEKIMLATQSGLTVHQVEVWLSNKRKEMKKKSMLPDGKPPPQLRMRGHNNNRRFPEATVNLLKNFFNEKSYPPTSDDTEELAKATGLSFKQINDWAYKYRLKMNKKTVE